MSRNTFEDWARLGATQKLVRRKEELARAIMESAIEKVADLGFTMRVGKNKSASTKSEKHPLNPEFIFYHNPEKT